MDRQPDLASGYLRQCDRGLQLLSGQRVAHHLWQHREEPPDGPQCLRELERGAEDTYLHEWWPLPCRSEEPTARPEEQRLAGQHHGWRATDPSLEHPFERQRDRLHEAIQPARLEHWFQCGDGHDLPLLPEREAQCVDQCHDPADRCEAEDGDNGTGQGLQEQHGDPGADPDGGHQHQLDLRQAGREEQEDQHDHPEQRPEEPGILQPADGYHDVPATIKK